MGEWHGKRNGKEGEWYGRGIREGCERGVGNGGWQGEVLW